jgi:hypothetical protein
MTPLKQLIKAGNHLRGRPPTRHLLEHTYEHTSAVRPLQGSGVGAGTGEVGFGAFAEGRDEATPVDSSTMDMAAAPVRSSFSINVLIHWEDTSVFPGTAPPISTTEPNSPRKRQARTG